MLRKLALSKTDRPKPVFLVQLRKNAFRQGSPVKVLAQRRGSAHAQEIAAPFGRALAPWPADPRGRCHAARTDPGRNGRFNFRKRQSSSGSVVDGTNPPHFN
jgi:hypothetical protein